MSERLPVSGFDATPQDEHNSSILGVDYSVYVFGPPYANVWKVAVVFRPPQTSHVYEFQTARLRDGLREIEAEIQKDLDFFQYPFVQSALVIDKDYNAYMHHDIDVPRWRRFSDGYGYQISFNDGNVIMTRNLECLGVIPLCLRGDVKPNAKIERL